MKYRSFPGIVAFLAGRLGVFVSGVGRRLLVHFCALLVSAFISLSFSTSIFDSVDTFVFSYLGLICLFPRGSMDSPSWYLPALTGIVQSLLLGFLGLSWPTALFWGGVQTWLQRLLQSRGKLGWEWSVSPFLAVGIGVCLESIASSGQPATPLWSLPVLAVVGWCLRVAYLRWKMEPIHRRILADAVRRLQALATTRTFPVSLRQEMDLLQGQLAAYDSRTQELGTEGYKLVDQVSDICRDLEKLARKPAQDWNPARDRAFYTLQEINASLRQQLEDLPPAPDPSPSAPAASSDANETNETDARMNEYEKAAHELLYKQKRLPENIARHVGGIVSAAFSIVQCMRSDPQDRDAGSKFLARYLKAAHMIVDEYVRLAGEKVTQEDVRTALARSEEILERLEKAFREEHASLLRNDAINYTAELNTLDTLLKMRGVR